MDITPLVQALTMTMGPGQKEITMAEQYLFNVLKKIKKYVKINMLDRLAKFKDTYLISY